MNKDMVERQEEKRNKEPSTSLPRLLDPSSAVDSVVTKALETSACKLGLNDPKACIDRLKRCDPTAVNYYYYNVVRELGEMLGSWSKNIKAVYACSYDEEVNGEDFCEKSAVFLLVHMIILVEQKNKALEALLDAVDRALVQRHRHMLGFKLLEHALDAQVIDDTDVKNRTGYAALLRSVYQPPIRVWQSSPDIWCR